VTRLVRNPQQAQQDRYDIIVVGGGIYGAMLLLEAARRNQKALLLEKEDFGGGTSYNSLRIIHGGLRYLQTMDIVRFHESVAERQWFLQTYPEFVKPMSCLMPLYNKGAKRPAILKAALTLNDLLSAFRNHGVDANRKIPNGRILNAIETAEQFPGVIRNGLTGAALWHDAHAPDTQRIVIETLLWAVSLGANTCNYVEVSNLVTSKNTIAGVQAIDNVTGEQLEFHCNKIINATGPACRNISQMWDRDIPELFRSSVAWNILFDCPAPSRHALALTPDRQSAQTYFIHPWKGRLLAGTGHTPADAQNKSFPDNTSIDRFVEDLNSVLSDVELSLDKIERIYAGNLPVTEDGGTKLAKRAVFHDHGSNGGPGNLYSVSGIKFTTSHREAKRAIDFILGDSNMGSLERPQLNSPPDLVCKDYNWMPDENDSSWKEALINIIKTESVVHTDDLIYRRTSIGDNHARVEKLTAEISNLFALS
jgi:glycerol-3-phosphate dehydrogenase